MAIVAEDARTPMREEPRVPLWQRLLYSGPSVSLALASVMVSTFTPKLYSDVYKVSLSSIGYISLAALVFDAVSDPIVGRASDLTRTKYGRRRPYILSGGILLALVAGGLLSPPFPPGATGITAWATTFIILTFLGSTFIRVPWLALGVEMTSGAHEEKTAVFGTREIVWILGSVLAAALPLIVAVEDEQVQFRIIAAIVSVLTILTSLFCVRYVTESRYDSLPPRTTSFSHEFCLLAKDYSRLARTLWGLRSGRALFLTSTMYYGATSLNAFFFAYFVEYVVDVDDTLEVILITYILCGVLFVPIWVRLSAKFEKRDLLKAAMGIQSVALLLGFALVGAGDFSLYLAIVIMAGISFGGYSAMRFSMIGDVADLDEWRNDVRREGSIQGLFDLFGKLVAALLIGPSLIVFDGAGYVPNVDQTDSVQWVIRVCYALIPGCLGVASILSIMSYDLTRAEYSREKKEFVQAQKESDGHSVGLAVENE